MRSPYSSFPDAAFWQRAVSDVLPSELDPVSAAPPFRIQPEDRVMTAGSCFAQHIARYLRNAGFNILVTEPAHPIATPEIAEAFSYGMFTARYGNIYTARQLLQLMQRAYGRFEPQENVWERDGAYVDPFRPRIQPGGFASLREFEVDRRKHLAAVRRAFEQLDIFVFTLGLTESWRSRADGAVFPLCPGVAAGRFDPARYEFHNFSADEVTRDMVQAIDFLREINPRAKVLLTVSPVPLVATAEPRHVLVSTVYSKSVLRVAAEAVTAARENVAYFPSYEIITGNFSRGAYFGPDCRSVTEEGVAHVMRVFFRHFTPAGTQPDAPVAASSPKPDAHLQKMAEVVQVLCDEEALDGREESGGQGERRSRRTERRKGHAEAAPG